MNTIDNLLSRLDAIRALRGGCLCSMRESCDVCSYTGPAARMDNALVELIYEIRTGHARPPLTAADYAASVVIDLGAGGGNTAAPPTANDRAVERIKPLLDGYGCPETRCDCTMCKIATIIREEAGDAE